MKGILRLLILLVCLIQYAGVCTGNSTNRSASTLKKLKICNVLGGLDLTRLRSSRARSLFKGAIDDVELIREYFSEAIINGAIQGGLSNLERLKQTLDHHARNLTNSSLDTFTAGLGYTDDRIDRRIDRLTSSSLTHNLSWGTSNPLPS